MSSYGSRDYGRGNSPEPPRKRVRADSPSYIELGGPPQSMAVRGANLSEHPHDTSDVEQIYARGKAVPLMADMDDTRRLPPNIKPLMDNLIERYPLNTTFPSSGNEISSRDSDRFFRPDPSESRYNDHIEFSSGINRHTVSSASESKINTGIEQGIYKPLAANMGRLELDRLHFNENYYDMFSRRFMNHDNRLGSLDSRYGGVNSNAVDIDTANYSAKGSVSIDTLEKEYDKFIEEFSAIGYNVNTNFAEGKDPENTRGCLPHDPDRPLKKRLSGAQRRKLKKLASLKGCPYKYLYRNLVTNCSNSGEKEWCENLNREINLHLKRRRVSEIEIFDEESLSPTLLEECNEPPSPISNDVQSEKADASLKTKDINQPPQSDTSKLICGSDRERSAAKAEVTTHQPEQSTSKDVVADQYQDSQSGAEGKVISEGTLNETSDDSSKKTTSSLEVDTDLKVSNTLSKYCTFGNKVELTIELEEALLKFAEKISDSLSQKKIFIDEEGLKKDEYRIKCCDLDCFNWLQSEISILEKVWADANLHLKISSESTELQTVLTISDLKENPIDLFMSKEKSKHKIIGHEGCENKNDNVQSTFQSPADKSGLNSDEKEEGAVGKEASEGKDDNSKSDGPKYIDTRERSPTSGKLVRKRLSGAQKRKLRKEARTRGVTPREVFDIVFSKSRNKNGTNKGNEKDNQSRRNNNSYSRSRASHRYSDGRNRSSGWNQERENNMLREDYRFYQGHRPDMYPPSYEFAQQNFSQNYGEGPSFSPVFNEPDNVINVIIRDESQPLGRIHNENLLILEGALTDLLMKALNDPNSREVSVRAVGLIKGNYKMRCFDEYSYRWLEAAVNSFKPLWEGAKIKLVRTYEHKLWKTTVNVPDSTISPFDILIKLKEQNPLLQTGRWYLTHSHIKDTMQFLVLGIDQDSLDELEHLQFSPCYGSTKVKFTRPKGYSNDSSEVFSKWYAKARNVASQNE